MKRLCALVGPWAELAHTMARPAGPDARWRGSAVGEIASLVAPLLSPFKPYPLGSTKPERSLQRVLGVRQATVSRVGDVGDYVQRSFESFMAEEYARVLAFARATSGTWSEAEDLTQEAFLAAYRKWTDVARYERPDAFVRRVIANQQVSGVRRRVREAAVLERLRPGTPVDADLADPGFWTAVGRLPVRQRQVVALHYIDDRSVADIAVVLDIAEGTVKAHLHAARHALARILGAEIEEEDA